MATEVIYPDGETFSLTNLTGSYTDIDDDADSSASDSDYLDAQGGSSTSLIASFPTPSGDPVIGVDGQNFRARLQAGPLGGGSVYVYLYEGSNIELLEVLSVSGSWATYTIPWDASLLNTTDGSNVEVRFYARIAGDDFEISALEWNVEYAAAGGVAYERTLASRADATDTADRQLRVLRLLAAGLELEDQVLAEALVGRLLADATDVTDVLRRYAQLRRLLSESAELADALSREVSGVGQVYARLLAAGLDLSDALFRDITGVGQIYERTLRTLTDLADALRPDALLTRLLLGDVGTVDRLSIERLLDRRILGALDAIDQLRRGTLRVRLLLGETALGDSLADETLRQRVLDEQLDALDHLLTRTGRFRLLEEQVGLLDSLAQALVGEMLAASTVRMSVIDAFDIQLSIRRNLFIDSELADSLQVAATIGCDKLTRLNLDDKMIVRLEVSGGD